ncbi:TetR/AcrR family transcriptional regulator [Candidatus Binatia bacterium]|nr:TetR/AcrR family transcriptional regulator [Candidatus Binatia bacterium]
MPSRTRARILEGAAIAVARHGLAKLEMSDVSAISGVSRPTLYRYFPNRDALLDELASHEGQLFRERMLAAIEEAPPGAERVRVALEHATRHVSEHALLQRLLDTDPAFLLRGLREQFDSLKGELGALLLPLLHESELVRGRIATADQLLDWMVRLMISAFLLPGRDPEAMTQGLTAVYRILTARLGKPAGTRATRRGHALRAAAGTRHVRRSTASSTEKKPTRTRRGRAHDD